MSKRNRTYWV